MGKRRYESRELNRIKLEWNSNKPSTPEELAAFDRNLGEELARSQQSITGIRSKLGLTMWHKKKKNGLQAPVKIIKIASKPLPDGHNGDLRYCPRCGLDYRSIKIGGQS